MYATTEKKNHSNQEVIVYGFNSRLDTAEDRISAFEDHRLVPKRGKKGKQLQANCERHLGNSQKVKHI